MRQCAKSANIVRIVLGHQRGGRVGERQKAVVLGHEVGLAIDFDQPTDVAGQAEGDNAFRRDAARRLARLGAQFDPQQFLCLDHIALGFGQGPFALHHRRIGLAAQLRDHACANCSHLFSPYLVR